MPVLRMRVLDPGLRSERFPEPRAIVSSERQQRQSASATVGGGEEDAIVPHDRRRVAATGHRHLPCHALAAGPAIAVCTGADDALSGRPAPARPVLGGITAGLDHLHHVRGRAYAIWDGGHDERRAREAEDEAGKAAHRQSPDTWRTGSGKPSGLSLTITPATSYRDARSHPACRRAWSRWPGWL